MENDKCGETPTYLKVSSDILRKVSKEHKVESCEWDKHLVDYFNSVSESAFERFKLPIVDQHCKVQVIHCYYLEEVLLSHEQKENNKQKASYNKHKVKHHLLSSVGIKL
jgi:hypothetical protein